MKQSEAYKLVETLKKYCSEAYIASGEKWYYTVHCRRVNDWQMIEFFQSIDKLKYWCSTEIIERYTRRWLDVVIFSL